MVQHHCISFTQRYSVGEVLTGLGQRERRYIPDKQSQMDRWTKGQKTDRRTDKLITSYRVLAERGFNFWSHVITNLIFIIIIANLVYVVTHFYGPFHSWFKKVHHSTIVQRGHIEVIEYNVQFRDKYCNKNLMGFMKLS